MKRYLQIFILLICAGCAGTRTVRINYVIPDAPAVQRYFENLKNVYLRIEYPGSYHAATFNLKSEKLDVFDIKFFGFSVRNFAQVINAGIAKTGGSIIAYRTVKKLESPDPYREILEPSAILNVKMIDINISYKTSEREEQITDKQGQSRTVTVTRWTYSGVLDAACTLSDSITHNTITADHLRITYEEAFDTEPAASVKNDIADELYKKTAQDIVLLISLPVTERQRLFFLAEDEPDAQNAHKLAGKGKWDHAIKIWKERISADKANWKDYYNLGLAYEVKRESKPAIDYYTKARSLSTQDNKAKKINWNLILSDLSTSIMKKPTVPRGAQDWFGQRIAVLPFSDETSDVNAPLVIRQLVQKTLTDGGYNTIPIDELDKTLRPHGITQGGQLNATTPQKLAQWLNAERLVFAHVKDFNTINVGIYVKRSVEGNIRIWDASKGHDIWSSSIPVHVHGLPGELSAGGVVVNFISYMAVSWFESLTEKPMGKEAIKFVSRNLESLPLKP
ncbi:MAG: hypothetical protein GF384_04395 [Elusimicrobia bacterium]|nr:hypothetical protein [Elusimicrobiota bacterium]